MVKPREVGKLRIIVEFVQSQEVRLRLHDGPYTGVYT